MRSINIFDNGHFLQLRACRRQVDSRFHVRGHLHQWNSVSEIMVPASLELTIVAAIELNKYCKLKNKFWNASRVFTICSASYIKRTRHISIPRSDSARFGAADFPRGVIYCEWLLRLCRERPNFLSCILFTKEAHARQEVRFQRRFSINVWAGITNDRFTKQTKRSTVPRVFKQCVGRAPRIGSPLGERLRMWYLHDGAPLHFARPVNG